MQAIIDISEHANTVLNIIKARYGLKDKSAAIDAMATEYEEYVMEPALRPAYVTKAARIQRQKAIRMGTVAALRKRYEQSHTH